MSLIIYYEKAIYADRAFSTSASDEDVRYSEMDKLFISPDRMVAFVVCGNRPQEKDLEEYFGRLKYIFASLAILERHSKNPLPDDASDKKKEVRSKINDGCLDTIRKAAAGIRDHQDGKIFAISRDIAISLKLAKLIKDDDITSVFMGPSCGYGTGGAYWDLFDANGMTPADCYEHAWKVDESISKNFNTISMDELEPFSLTIK